jgi:hypothetical protein
MLPLIASVVPWLDPNGYNVTPIPFPRFPKFSTCTFVAPSSVW